MYKIFLMKFSSFLSFLCLKIQELGLSLPYMEDTGTHSYLRKLMALPFLPAIEIPTTFEQLRLRANSDSLKALVAYIDSTWVYSSTFPPKDCSVYSQGIRTNNDLEGWHNALGEGSTFHFTC